MSAAVAGVKRSASSAGFEEGALSPDQIKKARQDNELQPLVSFPDGAFRTLASCLGRHVFSSLCATSSATRDKVHRVMAESYLGDPRLSPTIKRMLVQRIIEEGFRGAVKKEGDSDSATLIALATPHAAAIFKGIMEESSVAEPDTAGSVYPPMVGERLRMGARLSASQLPLDREEPVSAYCDPLDLDTLAFRVQAPRIVAEDRVFERLQHLFPTNETVTSVNDKLGLGRRKQAFLDATEAAASRNKSRWIADHSSLLHPLFASLRVNPLQAEAFYLFLENFADSLVDDAQEALDKAQETGASSRKKDSLQKRVDDAQVQKAALLQFVKDFKRYVELQMSAIHLCGFFIKSVTGGTFPPSFTNAFIRDYLSLKPQIPDLGSEASPAVVDFPINARFPEIEGFLLAMIRSETAFRAQAIQTWLESPETQALLQQRDAFIVYAQTVLTIVQHIVRDLNSMLNYTSEIIHKLPENLSQKGFEKRMAELQKALSTLLILAGLFHSDAASRQGLQNIQKLLKETAQNLASFDTSAKRCQTLKEIVKAIKKYITARDALLDPLNVMEALGVAGRSFRTQLQALQDVLATPAAIQLYGLVDMLHFTGLGLSSFPKGLLSRFSRLKLLDLERNALLEVPPEIASLRSLNVLFLSNNPISSIPMFIWLLPRLTRLAMADCYLTHLLKDEAAFFAAPDVAPLRFLNVEGNCLSAIPEGFLSRFPPLWAASFAWNHLRTLPADLANLWPSAVTQKTAELSLSGNFDLRARTIPPSVWGSTNPVIATALADHKAFQTERSYRPTSTLALFYQAALFKKPISTLKECFERLPPCVQSLMGLMVWNWWHEMRTTMQQLHGVTLTPEIQAVHALHATLTPEAKAAHGIEHLYDYLPILVDMLEKLSLQFHDLLTEQEKATFVSLYGAPLPVSADQALLVVAGNIMPSSKIFDAALGAVGERLAAMITQHRDVLTDMSAPAPEEDDEEEDDDLENVDGP